MFNGRTLFVAGHARFPQGMAAKNVYETLTVTVEIDKKYGVILEASCTLATEQGRQFIGNLLKGYCLTDGTDEAIAAIQNHYRGKAANALIAAIKDLDQHYQQMKSE